MKTRKYKKRVILGVVCFVAALVFLINSFLVPKGIQILKPSSLESPEHLGIYVYRGIRPKLAAKATFVFAVPSGGHSYRDIIVGLLKEGQVLDQRRYNVVIDPALGGETAWNIPKELLSVTPANPAALIDTGITYVALVPEEKISHHELKPEEKSWAPPIKESEEAPLEYYFYFSVMAAKEADLWQLGHCKNTKQPFEKDGDVYPCFAIPVSNWAVQNERKLDLSKRIGALDQIGQRRYLIYITK
jgi:hypothetical protein